MQEIGTWVNWQNTTDHYLAGDPETEVKGVAVAWQARTAVLREAAELGCNLFVTHEQHEYPEGQVTLKGEVQEYAREKQKLIEENRLVIIRCHDTWDRMPKIGIVDAWGDHLGLGEPVARGDVENVYASPAGTLQELAKYVLAKTKELGQDSVEMLGDPKVKVTKVAVGCGAGTNYGKMVEMGADAIIGTDDGMRYWADGSWALDRGTPLVLVNHCVSEEPGMKKLAAYIREEFPGVKVVHIQQGSMYKTVGQ